VRRVARAAVGLVALGVALGFAPAAHALGPVDVEVGAKVGAGSNPVGGGLPNPLGVGVGGRAGISVSGLYAGVSAIDYLGTSGRLDLVQGTDFEQGPLSPHSFLFGVELGYGLRLARVLVLRAQVGLGDDVLGMGGGVAVGSLLDNIISVARPVPDRGYLYLEPGVTALFEVGWFFAGVDVNALVLPWGPSVTPPGAGSTTPFLSAHKLDGAATVHGQLGVRF
jgi:hypothetical protein